MYKAAVPCVGSLGYTDVALEEGQGDTQWGPWVERDTPPHLRDNVLGTCLMGWDAVD